MLGSGNESVLNNIKQLYTEISPNTHYSKGKLVLRHLCTEHVAKGGCNALLDSEVLLTIRTEIA